MSQVVQSVKVLKSNDSCMDAPHIQDMVAPTQGVTWPARIYMGMLAVADEIISLQVCLAPLRALPVGKCTGCLTVPHMPEQDTDGIDRAELARPGAERSVVVLAQHGGR